MNQNAKDVLDTMRLLLSDPKDQKWTQAHKLQFLNFALRDIISSESIPYIRVLDIPIRDNELEYPFPEDMLEPLMLTYQNIEGAAIVSRGWRSLIASYGLEAVSNNIVSVATRDIISDDKFIFNPSYKTDEIYSSDLPVHANENDVWVDSYNSENLVYICNESYLTETDNASLTISSELLAGSVDLVLSRVTQGISHISVNLIHGGENGTASLEVSGDANSRSDPLILSFTLYDISCSNDSIIALAPVDISITGTSNTHGSIVETTLDFDNAAANKWTQQFLQLRYTAIFPKLVNLEDELPNELPTLLRTGDCIAYVASASALATMKGDEQWLIVERSYSKKAKIILDKCRKFRNGNSLNFDFTPE